MRAWLRGHRSLGLLGIVPLLTGILVLGPSRSSRAIAAATPVTIADFLYSPDPVHVAVGDTITWTNTDTDPHDATSTSGVWGSGTLRTGQSYSYTFTQPGTYPYICAIHPWMTGTVIVGQAEAAW